MKLRTLIAAIALSTPLAALAQVASTPRIDQRQANQDARVQQGVQSGALTSQEAARLAQGQAQVQKLENRAVADGVVSGQERARIEQAQDVQDRRIARQKHDRQHDYNHDGRNDRRR